MTDELKSQRTIRLINENTIARRNEFQKNVSTGAEATESYQLHKHKFPYYGFVPFQFGELDFVLFSANDDVVCWEYFWLGSYESEVVDTWLRMTRHAETVLDIGAYTGLMSIIANLNNSSCSVHAFEPIARTVERLSVNLKVNRIANKVRVHPVGASSKEGTAEFMMPRSQDFLGTGNSIFKKPNVDTVDVVTARTIVIDDYIRQFEPRRISCIKLDVEGHEYEALLGMRKTIAKDRPQLIVETWPHEMAGIKEYFRDLDYSWKQLKGMNYFFWPN